ncbi:MAG TPA: hypothetical protein VK815_16265 [Candidatus Acidoferrales bacterium]|jgi:hypothetical protein|nr:hypothetical protein [Candidatus Acidoferrales bacterium]
MPVPICPKCRRTIPRDDVKIGKGVAYCRDCDQSYSLSDLVCAATVDLQKPPKGAWYTSDARGTVFGANIRNPGGGVGLLCVGLFWNGILSFYIGIALSSTLKHLHVPLPSWFPNDKMVGGGEMTVGMTLGLWLFLTPFIFIGLFLVGSVLSSFFGHTEIRIIESKATIFTGIGRLGWKQRFDASQVKIVKTHEDHNSEGASPITIVIEMNNGKYRQFGTMLTEKHRQFLLAALQKTVWK